MPELRYINKPIKRVDGVDKVTGAAKFMQDMGVLGMLVGKVLYSPYAHAKIKSINLEKALKVNGVAAIVTHKDLPAKFKEVSGIELNNPLLPTLAPVKMFRGWGFQADGVVRCAGSPVAAVAAKSEEAALQALDLVDVEYEPLPVILDPEEAVKPGAPQIHPDIPDNTIYHWNGEVGNLEKGFKEADVIFDEVVETQPQSHFSPDVRGAIAWWEGERPVVCTTSMQPYGNLLPGLAQAFGMLESKVKIFGPPYMGGCYGGRAFNDVAFVIIAALLAKKARKPVKLSFSRQEDMTALARPSTRLYAKVGAKKDGTITAVHYKSYLNPGMWFYPPWSMRYYTHLFKVIKCPNIKAEAIMVATNRLFGGAPYRGLAYLEATASSQVVLQRIAHKLGMDYLELLEKSFWRTGDQMPYLPNRTMTVTSAGIDEAVMKGKKLIGWDDRKDPEEYLGVGYCSKGSMGFPANVEFRLNRDGSIQFEAGVVEIGSGQHTTLTYMAAEAIGAPPDTIQISKGFNSETQPWDGGQRSERTTANTGLAVLAAAKDFRQKIFALCSTRLGVKPEELELQEGMVFVKADREKKMPLSAIGMPIIASGTFQPDYVSNDVAEAPCVAFVRLKIDKETGLITPTKLVLVNDYGRAINPPVAHTQNMGTLSGGLSFALTEDVIYDKEGRVLNANPIFYRCPTILDIPEFHSEIVEAADPLGPYGAKGAGEHTLTPTIPATTAAVFDALKANFNTPITPDKILKALGKIE
jgi:xanthine dehydrogenase molybdenum-binding subunit